MIDANENIKDIPYGITDYALIRNENYYYVDKTRYLKIIEKSGRYLFFIRPRRFGKSLFVNLMEAYFDVFHRDRFEEFFKGTWIYDHPTGEKNSYLVLKFNFSAVDPDPEHLLSSFLNYVRDKALDFIDKYDGYLSSTREDYFVKTIEESHSAPDILFSLLSLCKQSYQKLYVLIDEYDNFANTILSTVVTVKGPEKDKLSLEIPNETIKRLYYDYFEEAYRETGAFSLDLSRYSDMMTDLAYDGEWRPLFQYILGRMRESMSLRDLITGEKSIQAFLNIYLGLSDLYIIHAEKELNKGFADLVMEPFLARYEGVKYAYILEIKYLKAGSKPGDKKVEQAKTAAEEQLKRYHSDEKFMKNIQKTSLIKLALVFSGHEAVHIEEVNQV